MRLRKWGGLALIGAPLAVFAAGYFCGRNGRNHRQHLAAGVRHTARRGRRAAHHLGSELIGARERLEHRRPEAAPDELTLLDRVESELFEDRRIPRGKISFDIARGVITLRGELDDAAQIAAVEQAVREVAGVGEVENLLHVAGTPAPNKEAALRATGA